jgi:hypothetical protein
VLRVFRTRTETISRLPYFDVGERRVVRQMDGDTDGKAPKPVDEDCYSPPSGANYFSAHFGNDCSGTVVKPGVKIRELRIRDVA